jgi:hypothetical protein
VIRVNKILALMGVISAVCGVWLATIEGYPALVAASIVIGMVYSSELLK